MANATYVPPPAEELMNCLGACERFLHEHSLPQPIHAALSHAQFEAIHPFLDGNGRIGRILIALQLVERHVIPSPLLDLSDYFEAARTESYARLLAVTHDGAWESWLTYFLKGIAVQAQDAVSRIQRIDALFLTWWEILDHTTSRQPERALELVCKNPFWNVTGVAERLQVSFTTAQRTIDRLESAGIVALGGLTRRNRAYCANALLKVLEEPSKLALSGSA